MEFRNLTGICSAGSSHPYSPFDSDSPENTVSSFAAKIFYCILCTPLSFFLLHAICALTDRVTHIQKRSPTAVGQQVPPKPEPYADYQNYIGENIPENNAPTFKAQIHNKSGILVSVPVSFNGTIGHLRAYLHREPEFACPILSRIIIAGKDYSSSNSSSICFRNIKQLANKQHKNKYALRILCLTLPMIEELPEEEKE